MRWIGTDSDDFERWLRDAQNRMTLTGELESAIAEGRITLGEVGELPGEAAKGLRNAFVLLLEGIHRLQEYTSEPQPSGIELFTWLRKRTDARTDFTECVQLLEGSVIDQQLLDGEYLLREKRALDEPFGQLAHAIMEEDELQNAAEQILAKDEERKREHE